MNIECAGFSARAQTNVKSLARGRTRKSNNHRRMIKSAFSCRLLPAFTMQWMHVSSEKRIGSFRTYVLDRTGRNAKSLPTPVG